MAARNHHLTASALLKDMGPQASLAAAAAAEASPTERSAKVRQQLEASQSSQSQLRADAPSWAPAGPPIPLEVSPALTIAQIAICLMTSSSKDGTGR